MHEDLLENPCCKTKKRKIRFKEILLQWLNKQPSCTTRFKTKLYLPIALNPTKIGVVIIKFSNSKWRGHRSSLAYWLPDDSHTDVSLHCLHVNCHSKGRNQKPQTRTLDGQYAVNALKFSNQVIKQKIWNQVYLIDWIVWEKSWALNFIKINKQFKIQIQLRPKSPEMWGLIYKRLGENMC